jgi:hypothetical protein
MTDGKSNDPIGDHAHLVQLALDAIRRVEADTTVTPVMTRASMAEIKVEVDAIVDALDHEHDLDRYDCPYCGHPASLDLDHDWICTNKACDHHDEAVGPGMCDESYPDPVKYQNRPEPPDYDALRAYRDDLRRGGRVTYDEVHEAGIDLPLKTTQAEAARILTEILDDKAKDDEVTIDDAIGKVDRGETLTPADMVGIAVATGNKVDPTCRHPPGEGAVHECMTCGERDCPHGEPLHYHHDGCPACIGPDSEIVETDYSTRGGERGCE